MNLHCRGLGRSEIKCFRDIESQVVAEVTRRHHVVLALGGAASQRRVILDVSVGGADGMTFGQILEYQVRAPVDDSFKHLSTPFGMLPHEVANTYSAATASISTMSSGNTSR